MVEKIQAHKRNYFSFFINILRGRFFIDFFIWRNILTQPSCTYEKLVKDIIKR